MAILRCTCKHKSQDRLHGKQRRVCNRMRPMGGGIRFRCTVCGTIIIPEGRQRKYLENLEREGY